MITTPSPEQNPVPKPDHRSRPRKRRQPCGRDQAIYVAHTADTRSQAELAEEHNLSQSRISQILRRVAKWRQVQPSAGAAVQVGEEQRRLDRARHQELEPPSVPWLNLALRAVEDLAAGSDRWSEQDERLRQMLIVLLALTCEADVVRQRLSSLESAVEASNAPSASNCF